MTTRRLLALAAVFSCGLLGCTSSNTATCSFSTRATWDQSPTKWAKFRHDLQNTGTVVDSTVFMNVSANVQQKTIAHVFAALQPFAASPVINDTGNWIYIASTDGVLYKLNASDLTRDTTFAFSVLDPFTSTALVGRLSNGVVCTAANPTCLTGAECLDTTGAACSTSSTSCACMIDVVYIGSGSGDLYALSGADGTLQSGSWPSALGGFISASPTLNPTDGTVYLGSLGGFFSGVCPNGIDRFANVSVDSVQSSAAVGPDGTVYFGADDHQLRAIALNGIFKWTFSASAPIVTAAVVEVETDMLQPCTARAATCPSATECVDDATDDTTRAVCTTSSTSCTCRNVSIYAADRGGRIIKVDANGQPPKEFSFTTSAGPFSSSPALAGDRLYVGSDDGSLYAIDKSSGQLVWTFATGGAIVSSPAVASDGTQALIIFGSNDGNVYFIHDDGSMARPPIDIGAAVRSSPAIAGSDGTIYVGADDGRVYAIR